MSVQKTTGAQTDARPAAVDLTDKERYLAFRKTDGTFRLAEVGEAVAGVIQQGRAATYWATVATGGMVKVVASAAWTAGQAMQAGAAGTTVPGATNSYGIARNSGFSGELAEVVMDRT